MVVRARDGRDLMPKRVKFQQMLDYVRHSLNRIPEHRTGRRKEYEISDAGLGALAVFFAQSPSFLAFQRHMEEKWPEQCQESV